jgi:hypothetical protein
MLQRPGENNAWEPNHRGPNPQQHDDPDSEPRLAPNYFRPARFYCVETICAPCGVVIAWTKFAKSESPTNILNFKFIQQKNQGLIISVLIKAVKCLQLQWQMEVGIFGKKLLDLLWMPTTISTIEC